MARRHKPRLGSSCGTLSLKKVLLPAGQQRRVVTQRGGRTAMLTTRLSATTAVALAQTKRARTERRWRGGKREDARTGPAATTPAAARGKKSLLVAPPDRSRRRAGATEREAALPQTWQRRVEMESGLLGGFRLLSQNRPGQPPGGSAVGTFKRRERRRMRLCRAPRSSWLLSCRRVWSWGRHTVATLLCQQHTARDRRLVIEIIGTVFYGVCFSRWGVAAAAVVARAPSPLCEGSESRDD